MGFRLSTAAWPNVATAAICKALAVTSPGGGGGGDKAGEVGLLERPRQLGILWGTFAKSAT